MYASRSGMAEHARTHEWLRAQFEDESILVGVCWQVLYAFVRLMTSRRLFGEDAASLEAAWQAAMVFLHQDNARLIEPGPNHGTIAGRLLRTPGLSSDDVSDAYLAALAIEHGLELCTRDRGFARFDRLAWRDPLASD